MQVLLQTTIIAVALLLGNLVSVPGAKAQGAFVAAVGAGIVGRDLIQRAETALEAALHDAERGGNALIARSASEARVLIDHLNLNLAAQGGEVVRAIQGETRLAWMRLAELMDRMEAVANQAYDVRDASVIDLQGVLGTLPFVGDTTAIVAVRGLAVHRLAGNEHTVRITGTGLGPASDRVSSRLEFRFGDTPLTPARENRIANNTAEVVFNLSDLQAAFDQDNARVRLVPLRVTMHTTRPKAWWRFWGNAPVTTVQTVVWLSMFPMRAGTVSVVSRHKEFGWQQEPGVISAQPYDSRDCGEGRCRYHTTTPAVSVAGGDVARPREGFRRIVRGECSCEPLWGPRSCLSHHTRTFAVAESNTRGFCQIYHEAERNRYQAHAVVERYIQTGVSENSVANVPVLFGENTAIPIPAHMTTYEIIFRSITGQVERRAAGQASPFFQTQLIEEGDTDRLLVSATPLRLN